MIITKEQFINTCKYLRIDVNVVNNRLCLHGNIPNEMKETLVHNPKLETELILHKAIYDADLLDSIQERACIRWADGYSDSLFDAVLCNFKPLGEEVKRDSEGKIILKPRTDWEAELKKYE